MSMRGKHEEPKKYGLVMKNKQSDTYTYELPYLKMENLIYTHLKHDMGRLEMQLPSRMVPNRGRYGQIALGVRKM